MLDSHMPELFGPACVHGIPAILCNCFLAICHSAPYFANSHSGLLCARLLHTEILQVASLHHELTSYTSLSQIYRDAISAAAEVAAEQTTGGTVHTARGSAIGAYESVTISATYGALPTEAAVVKESGQNTLQGSRRVHHLNAQKQLSAEVSKLDETSKSEFVLLATFSVKLAAAR